ncbi:NUDIX domain-containing protein [Brevundimonas lenta]|uniref:GDP-mannose pyrophosphatase n=1 Tax=Brevundimonas lenta TaxID=424796 RepID=A0A7W6JDY4_9CAUL|nr:NUDIX hydrolase [Brevundimonas lenta]MBB4083331.1 8-oxo-dGTP pyrophosphatase MutT (NUDIX family) [Brevundimonas lenta]
MTDSRADFDADRPLPSWDDGSNRPPPWQDAGHSVFFESPWMRLTRHDATAPTGHKADYMVMRPQNMSVGVLPLHADGTVTLVGQQRFALMNWSWEMPEGGAPFNEDPLDGAKRELAEEAGLAAAQWRLAYKAEMSNSITDERAIAWLAWDFTQVPIAPDETEIIRVIRVPFGDLLREVARGSIRDMFTLATVLRAYHMAKEGELPADLSKAMLAGV